MITLLWKTEKMSPDVGYIVSTWLLVSIYGGSTLCLSRPLNGTERGKAEESRPAMCGAGRKPCRLGSWAAAQTDDLESRGIQPEVVVICFSYDESVSLDKGNGDHITT